MQTSCHHESEAKVLKRSTTKAATHPDHTSALARLRKIKGQIAGIEKMIENKRYCVDILTQFRAVSAALNAIEMAVFEKHVMSCVKDAMDSKKPKEVERKVQELSRLISKRL